MDGRPFKMRKFRTMDVDAEARLPQLVPFDSLRDPMFKLPNDPRVTRIGRFLAAGASTSCRSSSTSSAGA